MTIEIEILCSNRIEDIVCIKSYFLNGIYFQFEICNNNASSSILAFVEY